MLDRRGICRFKGTQNQARGLECGLRKRGHIGEGTGTSRSRGNNLSSLVFELGAIVLLLTYAVTLVAIAYYG